MSSISIETKKFADLTQSAGVKDSDLMLIHDGNGVKTVPVNELKGGTRTGGHNCIYRGKNLGDTVTAEQYAAIEAGTFDDLYIGDYWTINERVYAIAAFDYYKINSSVPHHVVIVPQNSLYNAKMNDTNTTESGYVGSKMYTDNLTQAKNTIKSDFGANHILTHSMRFSNAASGGVVTGGAWYDADIALMSEMNVYGSNVFSKGDWSVDRAQFPIFFFWQGYITSSNSFWLRDIATGTQFCLAGGMSNYFSATSEYGVRPCFAIKA